MIEPPKRNFIGSFLESFGAIGPKPPKTFEETPTTKEAQRISAEAKSKEELAKSSKELELAARQNTAKYTKGLPGLSEPAPVKTTEKKKEPMVLASIEENLRDQYPVGWIGETVLNGETIKIRVNERYEIVQMD